MTLAVGDIILKLLDVVAYVDFGEEESLYDSSMTADVACLYLVKVITLSRALNRRINCAFNNV